MSVNLDQSHPGGNRDGTADDFVTSSVKSTPALEPDPAEPAPQAPPLPDKLAPPLVEGTDAVYVRSIRHDPNTDTERRTVIRMQDIGVLDIQQSFLTFELEEVHWNSAPNGDAANPYNNSQCFPAMCGMASKIDKIICRLGNYEVQRIDNVPYWLQMHYTELPLETQMYVRPFLDLSGTTFSARPQAVMTVSNNTLCQEILSGCAWVSDVAATAADVCRTRFPILEHAYQPYNFLGERSPITIPLRALVPSLFDQIPRYPAKGAPLIEFEILWKVNQVGTGVGAGYPLGGTSSTTALGFAQESTRRYKPDAPLGTFTSEDHIQPVVLPRHREVYINGEYLMYPASVQQMLYDTVRSGNWRVMYTKFIQSTIDWPDVDAASPKDQVMMVDRQQLTQWIAQRRVTPGVESSVIQYNMSKMGSMLSTMPFASLNFIVNNVPYWTQAKHREQDFYLMNDELFDGFQIPATVFRRSIMNVMANTDIQGSGANPDTQSGQTGIFQLLGKDFPLMENISNQPFIIRGSTKKSYLDHLRLNGNPFDRNLTILIGKAETILISTAGARML